MRKASFFTTVIYKYKFYKRRELFYCRLYQTYQLWIDEPFLHDAKLYIPALPVQYETGKLLQMFQNQIVSSSFVKLSLLFSSTLTFQFFEHCLIMLSIIQKNHITFIGFDSLTKEISIA